MTLETEVFSPATFVSPIRAIRALKHRDAVDLGIGEPLDCWPDGFADGAARAAAAAIGRGGVPYLPHVGHAGLRAHLSRRYATEHVLVTNGAQGALSAAIIAKVNAGDRVVVPDPGFVAYPHLIRWAGGTPVPVDARASAGGLDLAELERALKAGARGLVLGQPSNPTGLALNAADLKRMMELLVAHDAWLVCDVVYAELPMGWPAIPVPELGTGNGVRAPQALELALVSSTAKAWCAPGVRIGWLATSTAAWAERATRVHSLFNTHASSVGQEVALYLLEYLPVAHVAGVLRERGRVALAELAHAPALAGLDLAPGSFYLWMKLPGDRDELEFVKAAAVRADGVALIPGGAFGAHGRGHIRLSHGVPRDQVAEGSRRLVRALEGL